MSISRWLAAKLCPELAKEVQLREDIRVDPDVIRQWKYQINPSAVIWYDDPLKKPEPTVRIELSDRGRGDIYIDGVRQERVLGFTLAVRAGKSNVLNIEYDAVTAVASGDIEVSKKEDQAQ